MFTEYKIDIEPNISFSDYFLSAFNYLVLENM